jgi:hypothetical protein
MGEPASLSCHRRSTPCASRARRWSSSGRALPVVGGPYVEAKVPRRGRRPRRRTRGAPTGARRGAGRRPRGTARQAGDRSWPAPPRRHRTGSVHVLLVAFGRGVEPGCRPRPTPERRRAGHHTMEPRT